MTSFTDLQGSVHHCSYHWSQVTVSVTAGSDFDFWPKQWQHVETLRGALEINMSEYQLDTRVHQKQPIPVYETFRRAVLLLDLWEEWNPSCWTIREHPNGWWNKAKGQVWKVLQMESWLSNEMSTPWTQLNGEPTTYYLCWANKWLGHPPTASSPCHIPGQEAWNHLSLLGAQVRMARGKALWDLILAIP